MTAAAEISTLRRLPHWQLHLDALVCSRLHTPFGWGGFDCCLFGADAVLAVTGVDLAQGLRGYHGARQGLRLLRRVGGIPALLTGALGFPQRTDVARSGDIVVLPADRRGRDAVGVVVSTRSAVLPGARGLVTAPLSAASALWAVG